MPSRAGSRNFRKGTVLITLATTWMVVAVVTAGMAKQSKLNNILTFWYTPYYIELLVKKGEVQGVFILNCQSQKGKFKSTEQSPPPPVSDPGIVSSFLTFLTLLSNHLYILFSSCNAFHWLYTNNMIILQNYNYCSNVLRPVELWSG